jgi:FKBP-type peptidyl-prolyl cis-trans isomerase
MRLRIRMGPVAASMMALLAGCWEPQEIVPVAPPGFDVARVPTVPQGEGAQALGEQGSSVVTAARKAQSTPVITANAPPTPIGQSTTTPSGLTYETLREGGGQVSKSGDSVKMHYTGTLDDGTKFDSSLDRGTTYSVTLGMGKVIQGWDEGIPGMKVGEKRKLIIPPALAYAEKGMGKVPPNARLTFEVELVSIEP